MTRDQLQEFFSLPLCDAQEEFEILTAQAIRYAIDGKHILASKLLVKAADIATEALELARKEGK